LKQGHDWGPALRLSATSVGPSASERLRGRKGTVHSVFSRALNLLVGGGMVSLVTGEVGRGPFNVVIEASDDVRFDELRVGSGDAVRTTAGRLVVGNGVLTVALPARADVRRSSFRRLRAPLDSVANIEVLKGEILAHGKLGGMAGLPLSGGRLKEGPARLGPAASAARLPLSRLVEALGEGRLGPVAANALELVGLGPGLTPAADDVLVGLMLAFLMTARAAGWGQEFAAAANASICSVTDGRTNALSREFLLHAGRGMASERVVRLVERVLFGRMEDVKAAAREVLGMGATSGTDVAFGVVLGVTAGLRASGRKRR
jgi:Protein of unknown function (DUF2877)